MIQKILLASAVSLTSQFAFSAVQAVSVNENTASRVESTSTTSGTTTTSNYTIFGGYAGAGGGCASVSTSSVCDSCSAMTNTCNGNVFACAERSIHPTLLLEISLTLDAIPTNPTIRVELGSSSTTVTVDSSSDSRFTANSAFRVRVPWANICSALGLSNTCAAGTVSGKSAEMLVGLSEGSASLAAANAQKFTIKVRAVDATSNATLVAPTIDPGNDTGFSDFEVRDGDAKVYLRSIRRGNTGPSATDDSSSIKWQYLRVYYAKDTGASDFCSISLGSDGGRADLGLASKTDVTTELNEDHLKGLDNDVRYMFTIASVDEATIVSGFMDAGAQSQAMLDANNNTIFTAAEMVDRYTATPGEVVGLLEDQKCFIATAAFGSPMEPQVQILRKFRNQYLSTHTWGRSFVKFYYKHSPPIARWIAEHETVRALVRFLLWPLILLAELTLNWGLLTTIGFFAFFVSGLVLMSRIRRRESSI